MKVRKSSADFQLFVARDGSRHVLRSTAAAAAAAVPPGPGGTPGADASAFNPRGPWNAAAVYEPFDTVVYLRADGGTGHGYVVIEPVTGEPPTNGAYYSLMVESGDTGVEGGNAGDGSAVNWQGDWAPATNYVAGAEVFAVLNGRGSSWIAKQAHVSGENFPGAGALWAMRARGGDQGPAGAKGAKGDDGAQGPPGGVGPAGEDGALLNAQANIQFDGNGTAIIPVTTAQPITFIDILRVDYAVTGVPALSWRRLNADLTETNVGQPAAGNHVEIAPGQALIVELTGKGDGVISIALETE